MIEYAVAILAGVSAADNFRKGYKTAFYSKSRYFFADSEALVCKTNLFFNIAEIASEAAIYYTSVQYSVSSTVSYVSISLQIPQLLLALVKPVFYWIGNTVHQDRHYSYMEEYFSYKGRGKNNKVYDGLLPYFIPSRVEYHCQSNYSGDKNIPSDEEQRDRIFKDMLLHKRAEIFGFKNYKTSLRIKSRPAKQYNEIAIEESSLLEVVNIKISNLSYFSPKHIGHTNSPFFEYDSSDDDSLKDIKAYIDNKLNNGYEVNIDTTGCNNSQELSRILGLHREKINDDLDKRLNLEPETVYLKGNLKLLIHKDDNIKDDNILRVYVKRQNFFEILGNLFSEKKSFQDAINDSFNQNARFNQKCTIKISGYLKSVKKEGFSNLNGNIDIYDFNHEIEYNEIEKVNTQPGVTKLHKIEIKNQDIPLHKYILSYFMDIGRYFYHRISKSYDTSGSIPMFLIRLPIFLIDAVVGTLFMMLMLPSSLKHYKNKMIFNEIYKSFNSSEKSSPPEKGKDAPKASFTVNGNNFSWKDGAYCNRYHRAEENKDTSLEEAGSRNRYSLTS